MDAPNELKHRAVLSDYLAAERTFLAWVRSGLALMGFGFNWIAEMQIAPALCAQPSPPRYFWRCRTGHGHLSDFRSWFREYFIRKEF